MTKQQKVIFYFPDRNAAGGVQDLFYDIIKNMLSKNMNVGLIDYKDGNISSRLKSDNITLYDIDNLELILERNAIIVTNSVSKSLIKILRKNPSVKILFYNLFPLSFERINYFKGQKIPYLSSLLTKYSFRKFLSHNAVILMSPSALINMGLEDFSNEVCSKIVPVSISLNPNESQNFISNPGIVTLGRAEKWKHAIFFELMERLIDLKYCDPLTIVTDDQGAYMKLMPNTLKQNLEIKLLGPVPKKDLSSCIVNNGKLGVGMGLSALHMVKSGIPTIVVDAIDNHMPNDYLYSFLHQKKPYELGEVLGLRAEKNLGLTADKILQIYNRNDILESFWIKDFKSLVKQYDIENTVSNLLSNAEKSSLNYGALRMSIAKPWFVNAK